MQITDLESLLFLLCAVLLWRINALSRHIDRLMESKARALSMLIRVAKKQSSVSYEEQGATFTITERPRDL